MQEISSFANISLASASERDAFAHFLCKLMLSYEILNEVALNQALVSFGTDEETRRVIEAIQDEGTCWCGGTVWQGRAAMRISVSSWVTTDGDVEKSLAAMLRVAKSKLKRR